MNRYIIVLFLLGLFQLVAQAQLFGNIEKKEVYNADSVRAELDKMPYFTLFKDNYLTMGIPLGSKPTSHNSDVKFQLSIMQRLTKSRLPFDSYLFIQYTQKTFWNVLENSLPIRDLNFNPGLGLGHLIIRHNKYIGKAYVMLEHDSNGKDSIFSRSWNRVSFGLALDMNRNWQTQFKTWIPIIDGRNNEDILKYNGIFQTAVNYRTDNKRFNCGVVFIQRKKWLSYNTQLELSYKFNDKDNQYFFVQYYNGYGESLLDYNKYTSMVRAGFVIKPRDFSLY